MSGVDAYLDDLGRRLKGRLSENVAEARIRETRVHLEEAVRLEGEETALRRFGPPAANARALVRQARGDDAKSVIRLSPTVGLPLAMAFTLPNAWLNDHLRWSSLEYRLSLWLPFFGVLFFFAHCLRTRRWLAAPVALWAAAGIALTYVVSAAFPLHLNAAEQVLNLKWARGDVARWEWNARVVAGWRAGNAPLDAFPQVSKSVPWWSIAGLPIEVSFGEVSQLDLQRRAVSPSEAERAWREHGAAMGAEVAKWRPEAQRALAAAERGHRYASVPLAERLRFGAVGIVEIATVLLAFNALALGFGKLLDAPSWQRGLKA